MSLNTLIVGAGAIGSLIGAKLALSSQLVTLAGRPGFVQAVRAGGLRFEDEAGQRIVRNLRVAASQEEAFARAETAFDLVILTVKSYDTAPALAELTAVLAATGAPAPAVLSLQNGVGNEEAIAAALPAVPVLAGSITTPVSVNAPGDIRVDKPRYGLGLGAWRPAAPTPLFAESVALLGQAGFIVKTYPHAQGMKWTKLLMNMMGNAVCAILDEPPAVAFADNAIVDLEIQAWREALAVMRAAQIPTANLDRYPFAALAPLIRYAPKAMIRPILRSQIAGARGGKLPSLALDLQAGKAKNEVEWLNGAVVKQGHAAAIPTPVNQAYTRIVGELALQPERRAAWRGNHRQLLANI